MRERLGSAIGSSWHWIVLGALLVPAIWHVVDYPDDRDPEFPRVARPTFSRLPPPAYRLAEPGDTLDRVAVYLAAGSIALSLGGLAARRAGDGPNFWPSAIGIGLALGWHASTPGPSFDGWHGLGWRAILDPAAPAPLRGMLMLAVVGLAALIAGPLLWHRRALAYLWRSGSDRHASRLFVLTAVLVALRQFDLPGVEPVGYWPRWAFLAGVLAFDLALIRSWPAAEGRSRLARRSIKLAGLGCWGVLIVVGIWLTWYHRPLNRLRTVEPGRIYISAMPTYRGLEVAQRRHGFRTIINLFPEDTPGRRSLDLPDELRFARERGITYLNNPSDPREADEFLDRTLALAQDPDAWPILVHCHGCMDRTPAWMGIYRFLVQGRPLNAIFREIEQHRGYRPKASVTLLYNRALPPRAPERFAADPTAKILRRAAAGTRDPAADPTARRASPKAGPGVSLRSEAPAADLDRRGAAARVPLGRHSPAPRKVAAIPMTSRTKLSAAAIRTRPPAITDLMNAALADPGLISLAAGFVDPATLPTGPTAHAVSAIMADPAEGRRALQYGTTQGDPRFRAQLVALQERSDGAGEGAYAEARHRVVVTNGSAQLLYLVLEALIDPGDIVLVESPTYFVFLGNLERFGARAIGVDTDADGIRPDSVDATLADLDARGLLDRVKLIYSVSEHGNPTGISLAANRRAALVAVAQKWSTRHHIYVLEDAAYRGLTYAGAEPKSIWGHDRSGDTVILARTFSKAYSPGIKVGYGILPEPLLGPVLRLKGNHDFGTSHLAQSMLATLLADGSYDRHVAALVESYRAKRDVMLGALDEHLGALEGDLHWTRPAGGLFVWLSTPEGLDTGRDGPLFARCRERGVLYVPGAYAFADEPGPAPTRHARLCFGVPPEADLVEGVRRLAMALADCLDLVA